MYLSLPFFRLLSLDELKSVIFHELSHYKGNDTRYSQKFFPIYRGTCASIVGLRSIAISSIGRWALLPAFILLNLFLRSFEIAEKSLSRDRELAADKLGAQEAGTEAATAALVKVHAFSKVWDLIEKKKVIADPHTKNMSKMIFQFLDNYPISELFKNLQNEHTFHPANSHPLLSIRLEALGQTLASIKDQAADIHPRNPAIALIDRAEEIEERATASALGVHYVP